MNEPAQFPWFSPKVRNELDKVMQAKIDDTTKWREFYQKAHADIEKARASFAKVDEAPPSRKWGNTDMILLDDTLAGKEPLHPLVTGVLFSSHTTVSLDTVNGINRRTSLPRNPARRRAISLTTLYRLQKNAGASSKPTAMGGKWRFIRLWVKVKKPPSTPSGSGGRR
jgi:hypothetical protein